MHIRATQPPDDGPITAIARALVRSGDTYAFDPQISDDELLRYWTGPTVDSYVALIEDEVVGCFRIKPNHPGPGQHVANASYVVRADVRGKGIGRAMGLRSIALARDAGYRAMQFNIVLASNAAAVHLWQALGFEIIGTVPDGFRLTSGAYDDFHLMFRTL